jgi:hypothetical protein
MSNKEFELKFEHIFAVGLILLALLFILEKLDEPRATEKNKTFDPLCKSECINRNGTMLYLDTDTLRSEYSICQCKYDLGTGKDYADGQMFKIYKNGTCLTK